jgi:abortive infection bacteriophage resistance protein
LAFGDEGAALEFLQRVSYYRLKGYLLHFERKVTKNTSHAVPPGTTFESVLELYELDRKLRLLMFEAVERIEICFRSAICNTRILIGF